MTDKKTDIKEIAGLLCRLIVGGVFIYAGAIKTLAPAEEFAFAIEGYKVFNSQLSLWAAYIMPWVELYAGLLLAAGVFTRLSALLNGALLVSFEIMLSQAWLRHLPVTSCGCFGNSRSNSLSHEFLQNICLLAMTWAAFRYGRAWSADTLADKP